MGSLDHVHIRAPDRTEAARWYEEHPGFEQVERFDSWAQDVDGGPLQMSADGGRTMLALFEASEGRPMIPQRTGVAFRVDPATFVAFARSLPGEILHPNGHPAGRRRRDRPRRVLGVDLVDPWGNRYELCCDDHAAIEREMIQADASNPFATGPASPTTHARSR